MNPFVFFIAAILICGFVVIGVTFTEAVATRVEALQSFIVQTFGWFYIASVGGILLFVLWLMFSRFGNIRLGPNDARPEYSRLTWFAMLFSAGMGIGLLFYSVAEPILHYSQPPSGEGGTVEAAKTAMNLTFFHWGLHPWGVYALVGLALAYFGYRRGQPLTIRSAFYPLLGDRIHGPIGNLIDIAAVVSTLFGLATSLGLGVMQINTGLGVVFGTPDSVAMQIGLIAGITAVATVSVVSGVNVGIRRLSEFNVTVGALLCIFVLVAGPTVFLAKFLIQSTGFYLQNLPETTFWTATFRGEDWLAGWTVFYWGWWIAWSPFVGMFIARVSRGRTIREFIIGTLLCPSIATFVWLSVFGGTAMHQEMNAGGIAEAVDADITIALFEMLGNLPWGAISSVAATLVIITFFVTSSDSGSLVIDIITSGGHPDPPIRQRLFWAILEGVVAATLLYTGYRTGNPSGGLIALQTAAITTALPFCIILVLMVYSIWRGLHQEHVSQRRPEFTPPEMLAQPARNPARAE